MELLILLIYVGVCFLVIVKCIELLSKLEDKGR